MVLTAVGNTTEVLRRNVALTPNANGVYIGQVDGIPAGNYDVYLKGANQLAVKINNFDLTATPATRVDWTTLPIKAGDVTGTTIAGATAQDNLIDLSDWQKVFNNISLSIEVDPMSTTNPKAIMDLNCDKVVDTQDLQLIYNNVKLEYGPGGQE